MRNFNSFGAFATRLAAMQLAADRNMKKGLDRVAAKVEKTAKKELGKYQKAVGPFPAWAELADSTKADRVRQGYSENDPGLRSGKMRKSIGRQVQGHEAVVGSNDQNLVWFELGTEKQPPRPVLGPAVEHNQEAIREIMGGAVVQGILGDKAILGYDREI